MCRKRRVAEEETMGKKIRVAFLIGDYPGPERERREKVALSYSNDEIEVGLISVATTAYNRGNSPAELQLVAPAFIDAFRRAEAEGYDAFITNCLDLGFHELKEMVNIPVVFMTQATLAFYSQLAPNFAFLVNSERLHHFFKEIAERYSVRDRMVPGGWVTFAFTDYANLWNNPETFVKQYLEVAGELTSRGATALCPAGLYLSQWLIDQGIREVNGALVMDPLAASVKTAEMMVDFRRMGVNRCQTGAWAAPAPEVHALLAKELAARN